MGIEASFHKGLHDHRVTLGSREFRAGWPATFSIASGALLYSAKDALVLPWKQHRGAAIVLLTLCAYAACFRERDEK